MKYVDEYRDGAVAKHIAAEIARTVRPDRLYRFMEFCGGHTHAISRFGLTDLLPANVTMIHGPGCPVCVLPVGRLDMAIALAERPEVTLCTYGDLMRVPDSRGQSLLKAKAAGADIRMIYSTLDALRIAREEPSREVVFFAIGFETTTPPTALAIRAAADERLSNFSVFCNHVLTPPAIRAMLERSLGTDMEAILIDGFIGPSHVSAVIGTEPYHFAGEEFGKPVVVTGFEPLDVMQAVLMLVHQINEGRHVVENQYARAVQQMGNRIAQAAIAEVFELRDSFEWRGLGAIAHSALQVQSCYSDFDAERRFNLIPLTGRDNPACACAHILSGTKRPTDCRLFGTACTPDRPLGPCMVSSEGACAAHWTYGRFRDHVRRAS